MRIQVTVNKNTHVRLQFDVLQYSFTLIAVLTYAWKPADINEEFFAAVKRSRCVVIVLSGTLLDDENCRYCLDNIINVDIDVIYVVYNLDISGEALSSVGIDERVQIAMQVSRHKVTWPTEVQWQEGFSFSKESFAVKKRFLQTELCHFFILSIIRLASRVGKLVQYNVY
jgi:hypothetical protein